ncbi:MAG: SDR family oxidoreductase [Actinobacteria bacterium]|nr:SDR family oxidoreductase [Actinomycetota bacterium]
MAVLVTGGAGFIGSNLALRLLEEGARVKVLDDLSTGRMENLEEAKDDIEFIRGDIRDEGLLERTLKGVEVVFHQAALPSVPRSIEDPLTTHQVNTTGTLTLLLAAREAGVRRVVYASSSSVYGDSPTLPKVEDMPPDPKSPYALSKYAGERYCQLFTRIYGLETVSLRYFNVFGPRQDPTSQYAAVIPRFITGILSGKGITIYGDGKQTRDFTYVENAVQANLKAALAEGAAGEVFNVACGKSITVHELALFLMDELGREVPIEWAPPRPGEVRDSLASITKALNGLAYTPAFDVRQGLKKAVAWYGNRD